MKDKILKEITKGGGEISFKTAFMATLGFYAAQLLVTVIFISMVILGFYVLSKL